jgi:futalosine hydrolase
MILLVSATINEVSPLISKDDVCKEGKPFTLKQFNGFADMLVTGVGVVATAFHLTRAIESKKYKLIINLGIAGAYSQNLEIGEIVTVNEDSFADIGIDNRGSFIPISQSGLMDPNHYPFSNGKLKWPFANHFPILSSFKGVSGVTVSTTTGSAERIETISKLYNPEIETMEGAAVFYCCMLSNTPFICLRSISNHVEPRDISKWNVPLAVEMLNVASRDVIEKLSIVY